MLQKGKTYLCFLPVASDEYVLTKFRNRYGEEPAVVVRDGAYLWVGPVPDRLAPEPPYVHLTASVDVIAPDPNQLPLFGQDG